MKKTIRSYSAWEKAYSAADLHERLRLGREHSTYFSKYVQEQEKQNKQDAANKPKPRDSWDDYQESLTRMPEQQLEREYFDMMKESLGGHFRGNAAKAQTYVAQEYKRRGVTPYALFGYIDVKPEEK